MSRETWKNILKILVTVITTVAGVLGVQAMPLN
ncbi:smalltalk protein [Bacteroides zoogleoformans]|nr:smalltalk protein [Bacteroides zoogleoformans]